MQFGIELEDEQVTQLADEAVEAFEPDDNDDRPTFGEISSRSDLFRTETITDPFTLTGHTAVSVPGDLVDALRSACTSSPTGKMRLRHRSPL